MNDTLDIYMNIYPFHLFPTMKWECNKWIEFLMRFL